jgi:oligosaccharide repeat unit polymerase
MVETSWLMMQAATFAAVAVFFWRRFGTLINPPTLFLLSIAATETAAMVVDLLGDEIGVHGNFAASPGTLALLYTLGGIAFVAPWLPVKPPEVVPIEAHTYDDLLPAQFMLFAAISSIVLLGIAVYILGGVPILRMASGEANVNEFLESLVVLPPGLLAALLLSNFVLIFYLAMFLMSSRAPRLGTATRYLAIAACLISTLWQANRQLLLILVVIFVARYAVERERTIPRSKRLEGTPKRMLLAVGLGIIFLLFFNTIRALRTEGGEAPYEILGYFAWPAFNLANVTNFADYVRREGIFLLTEIMPSRFGSMENILALRPILVEPTSPSGYFAYWFLDFDLAGAVMGGLSLSLATRFAYKFRHRNEALCRCYLLMLWCCATVGVYSHFLTLNFFLLPLAFCLSTALALAARERNARAMGDRYQAEIR